MSSINRDPSKINAGLTFMSIMIIGVIIAVYVVKDEKYRAPIIISFFILSVFLTGLELASIVRASNKIENQEGKKRKKKKRGKKAIEDDERDNKEKEMKLARYVADLFDEEIPFDELEDNAN